jgi:hypothetical protein
LKHEDIANNDKLGLTKVDAEQGVNNFPEQ